MLFSRVLAASGVVALTVLQLVALVSSEKPFPILLNTDSGSINFVKQVFPRTIAYVKLMEVKSIMNLVFTNVNLVTSQIKIYVKDGAKYSEFRSLSGSQPGTIKVSIHSKDQALVIITKGTGTFSITYTHGKSCNQYCTFDHNKLASKIACGTLTGKHAAACTECKLTQCARPISLAPSIVRPFPLNAAVECEDIPTGSTSCSPTKQLHLSCQLRCYDKYIPRNMEPSALTTECRPKDESAVLSPLALAPVEGYWTNNVMDYCLTKEQFISICLSDDINLSKTCSYNATTAAEKLGLGALEIILPPPKTKIPAKCRWHCRKRKGGKRGFKVKCARLKRIGAKKRCRACQKKTSCLKYQLDRRSQ